MARGRPKAQLDPQKLRSIMRFRPSLSDVAGWFQVSEDTIERRCEELDGLTFAEFRAKYLSHTKLTLIQKAMSLALEGDRVMLKFCLKNLAGWIENPELATESNPIRIVISPDEANL